MTHLKIELSVGLIEYVANSVVEKLYELVTNSTLDNESNLLGTVHIDTGYRDHVNTITTNYPDFHVLADNYAILFEDPNMVTYLNSIGVGSNGTVTEALAAAATIVANSLNTTVTKFNELKYFTNVTKSRDGLSGRNEGNTRFYNWTALLEVDISNFTSLGHDSGAAHGDTFCGCTALTTVTASDKLVDIGHNAFSGCSNLTTISGLDGTITLHSSGCFYNCSSLTSDNFSNVQFKFGQSAYDNIFLGCSSLTSITLDSSVTTIPAACFSECTNLSTIDLSNIVTIRNDISGWGVFRNCKALTSIDLSSCTSIGSRAFGGCSKLTTVIGPAGGTIGLGAFYGCTKLTTIDLSNVTSIGNDAFRGCSSLSNIDLSNVTSIGSLAFLSCSSLTSVGDSSNITSIGAEGFRACTSLTSINLSNCTSLGYACFNECTSLQSVTGIENLTTIPHNVFRGCSSLLGNINQSLTLSGNEGNEFYNCSNLTFPSQLTISTNVTENNLGKNFLTRSFENTDLSNTDIILDSSIKIVGQGAFTNTHFKTITANSVKRISGWCFYASSAEEILLPSLEGFVLSHDRLPCATFANCPNLLKVTLGHFAGTIVRNSDYEASNAWFYNTPNLKIFDVGDSITEYECNAMGGNFRESGSSLEKFIIRNTTVPTLNISLIPSNYQTAATIITNFGGNGVKIYVPDSALNDYKTATNWSIIASYIYPLSDIES